jgi:hypothetical protein
MTALSHARTASSLVETIEDYLDQLSLSLRPQSVVSYTSDLKSFAIFIAEHHPEVCGAGDLERRQRMSRPVWILSDGPRLLS